MQETPSTTGQGKRYQQYVRLIFQIDLWIMITVTMLKSIWSGSSRSPGARGEVVGTTSKAGNSTPFTDFVLSRLPDEGSHVIPMRGHRSSSLASSASTFVVMRTLWKSTSMTFTGGWGSIGRTVLSGS